MATKGKRKRNNIIHLFAEVRLPGNTYIEKRGSRQEPQEISIQHQTGQRKSYTRENKKSNPQENQENI